MGRRDQSKAEEEDEAEEEEEEEAEEPAKQRAASSGPDRCAFVGAHLATDALPTFCAANETAMGPGLETG